MITDKEFENIIERSESSILDFKTKLYDFVNDNDGTSKFVKDVVCLCNTIRNENAYIIFGVEEKNDGTKILHGIDYNVDDAILQDKIKNKVFPIPSFHYYTINYNNSRYGILEIPITKYHLPISAIVKMKGIDIGRIYYRQGTSNTEAIGNEIIKINNWLQSLPENGLDNSCSEEIGKLLIKLTSSEDKLSTLITEILSISKKYRLNEIIEFCSDELNGILKSKIDSNSSKYKYRIQKVIISLNEVEVNTFLTLTPDIIKSEMKKYDDFFDYRFLFNQPISEIEEYYLRLVNNKESLFATFKINSNQIFPVKDEKGYQIYVYIFKDTYINLMRSIKQKAIDILMKV